MLIEPTMVNRTMITDNLDIEISFSVKNPVQAHHTTKKRKKVLSKIIKKNIIYSKEFKNIAVSECLKRGLKETSTQFGISTHTLSNWVLLDKSKNEKAGKNPTYEELEEENLRLKNQLIQLSKD